MFTFNEHIQCHGFQILVLVEGLADGVTNLASKLDNDRLNIVCRDNEIRFTIDQTLTEWSKLLGKSIMVKLNEIYDLVGNQFWAEDANLLNGGTHDIVHVFKHANINETETEVEFEVELSDLDCATTDNASVQDEAAIFLHLSEDEKYRVEVLHFQCISGSSGPVLATYKIFVNKASRLHGPSRALEEAIPSTHLVRRLIENPHPSVESIRNVRFILGDEDEKLRANAKAARKHGDRDHGEGLEQLEDRVSQRLEQLQQSSARDADERHQQLNQLKDELKNELALLLEHLEERPRANSLGQDFVLVAMLCILAGLVGMAGHALLRKERKNAVNSLAV